MRTLDRDQAAFELQCALATKRGWSLERGSRGTFDTWRATATVGGWPLQLWWVSDLEQGSWTSILADYQAVEPFRVVIQARQSRRGEVKVKLATRGRSVEAGPPGLGDMTRLLERFAPGGFAASSSGCHLRFERWLGIAEAEERVTTLVRLLDDLRRRGLVTLATPS